MPLPLFDCLYCVGIHEHLVLQTSKERSLTGKYGCVRRAAGDQDKLPHNALEDFAEDSEGADFYEKMEKLDQLFVVNLMAADVEVKNLRREHGEPVESAEAEDDRQHDSLNGRGDSKANVGEQEGDGRGASACLSGRRAKEELRALAVQH